MYEEVRQPDPKEVIDRIKAQVGVRSDEDLANWISRQRAKLGSYKLDASKNVIRQTVANWRAACRAGVPLEVVAEIAEWEGVYMEWLLWGEEPRYRPRKGDGAGQDDGCTEAAAQLTRLLSQEPGLIRTIREAADAENAPLRAFLVKVPKLKPETLSVLSLVADQLLGAR